MLELRELKSVGVLDKHDLLSGENGQNSCSSSHRKVDLEFYFRQLELLCVKFMRLQRTS